MRVWCDGEFGYETKEPGAVKVVVHLDVSLLPSSVIVSRVGVHQEQMPSLRVLTIPCLGQGLHSRMKSREVVVEVDG